jgi:hypothetical protein
MIDNYDDTMKALCRYLMFNAPHGAERDQRSIQTSLNNDEIPSYISLEFRREDGDSCVLYVRLNALDGDYGGTIDEDGNRWHISKISCAVSWPSYGSADVKTSQRRLDLMQEVTCFAGRIEACYSTPLYHMTQTYAEIESQKNKWATERAVSEVRRLVELNSKGLKLGDGKTVYSGTLKEHKPLGAVEVVRTVGCRNFKYTAYFTSNEGFNFVRTE